MILINAICNIGTFEIIGRGENSGRIKKRTN